MLSCTEPVSCLRWVMERPLFRGESRRSREFRLLQRVWHLEIALRGYVSEMIQCEVWLHPHPVAGPPSMDLPNVDCLLEARGETFRESEIILRNASTQESTCILRTNMDDQYSDPDPPEEKWTVFCMFRATETCESFSLQLGSERVQFSSGVIETEDRSVRDVGVQVTSEVPRDIESLSSDFSNLLKGEIIQDVDVECSGRTFRVHRSVLAARSQVYRAMFQNEMLESESRTVKIRDMDAGVLQKFLKFLYSGKPDELSEECVSDLYAAADKYDVPSLKTACAYWTSRNLTVENCIEFLKMAETHSDYDLKAAVVAFVVENPSVMKCESWLGLRKELPWLALEVCETYIASLVPVAP